MAATMTYNSLVTDLQAYLERTDANYVNQIPRIIMMAEWRIAADLKGLGYLQVQQGTFTPGNNTLAKPAYWRETVSFSYNNGTAIVPILPRSYEYARQFWPQVTGNAPPRFYSDYDFNNWMITPPPDQAYTFEVLSFVRIQPLDAVTQTNWITTNAPQVLLNACILESMYWLKNFPQAKVWEDTYLKSLSSINREDIARVKDRSAVRDNI
jgi:hypothetical protein